MIDLIDLKTICPLARSERLGQLLPFLNATMVEFVVNTPMRQAAFLAQLAHESGQFRYLAEIASGEAYEGRVSLGNTSAGDGRRFKGRGLIQVTGRANYAACSIALFGNPSTLLNAPELLEYPENACRSAGWFWDSRRLNQLADIGDMKTITKRINGGFNGFEDRMKFYSRAKIVLGVP